MTDPTGNVASRPEAGPIGPLERRVLDALWRHGGDASVRDLQPEFPDTAYTTLMTTLDRLHRKALLDRHKVGRAFFYRTRVSRAAFESARAVDVLRLMRSGDGESIRPLLSMFVDALGARDGALLDELEALVRTRRAELERQGS